MSEHPADQLSIAVAQLNPIVGDVAGNLERARAARAQAARDGADVVVFSELFIAGYPPEDLVLKPAFQSACRAAIETLARETADGGPAVLIGAPWVEDAKLYNAYALLAAGRVEAIRFKVNLPNYGVFDEKRVFAVGQVPGPVNFRGVRLGLPICEDTWTDWGDYENMVECLAETGAELLIVPNGSPYWRDKCGSPPECFGRARHRVRFAASLRQPGWRSGRTCFRRRVVCFERRPLDRVSAAGVPRINRHNPMVADCGRLAVRVGTDRAG